MARTAPVPNIPAIPGMNPGIFVMGGGGGGGGAGGKGGRGAGGAQGAGGENGGDGANGGGNGAGSCGPGSGGGCMNPAHGGGGGTHAGDPVDPIRGRVYTIPVTDLPLVGPIVFSLQRAYSSADHDHDVGLGPGWSHSFAWHVERRRRSLVVKAPFASARRFDLAPGQDSVDIPGLGQLRLRRGAIFLGNTRDLTYRFVATAPGALGHYRLSDISDGPGNVITLDYDDRGLLRSFVDSAGRRGTIRREPSGRIQRFEICMASGQTVWFRSYRYDDRADLVEVVDAEGHATRYRYDEDHRLLSQRHGSGRTVHYLYDTSGRCTETWVDYGDEVDPALSTEVSDRLADGVTRARGMLHVRIEHAGDSTTVIDSQQVRRFDVDENGSIKTASGAWVEDLDYDQTTRLVRYGDPNGASWRYQRDSSGNVVSVTDPTGATQTFAYDDRGYCREAINSLGEALSYVRDEAGNLLSVADAFGALLELGYDERGLRTWARTPDGGLTRFDHDDEGNLVRITEPDGTQKQLVVDGIGRLIEFVDAAGHRTEYRYNAMNALTAIVLPNGSMSAVELDAEGHIESLQSPDGGVWRLHWGGHHSVHRLDLPDGRSMHYRYDREARLVEVVNDRGERHVIERDVAGRVVADHFADGRVYRYRSDAAGRMIEHVNGAGETTTIERDEVGRIVRRAYADDSEEGFEYDSEGRLLTSDNGAVAVEFGYDRRARVAAERVALDGERSEVDVAYDAAGRLAELRWGRQAVHYERDAMGRAVRLHLSGETIERTFDPLGREICRDLSGGGSVVTEYDAMGAMSRRRLVGRSRRSAESPEWVGSWPNGTLFGETFHVSAAGELLERKTTEGEAEAFEYDGLGRIVAHRRGNERRAYCYRGGGCLDELTGPERDYARGGALLRMGEVRYEYDAEARRVAKIEPSGARTAYAYDGRGCLSAVSLPDGTRLDFRYDTDGRRVSKRVARPGSEGYVETRFTWWKGLMIEEVTRRVTAAGVEPLRARCYVHDDDGAPLAHRDSHWRDGAVEDGPWVHYLAGAADMPALLFGSGGAVLAKVSSTVWGEAAFEGAERSPLRYLGQYFDEETGLVYNRFRYYDPATGQFISADPSGLQGGQAAFEYARSRPFRFVDPLGLQPVTTTVTSRDGTVVGTGHSAQHPDHSSPQGIHPIVHQSLADQGPVYQYHADQGTGSVAQNWPAGRPPGSCGEPHAMSNYIREWERQHNGGQPLDPNNPRDRGKIQDCLGSIGSIGSQHDDGTARSPCPNCSQLFANLQARWGAPATSAIQPGFMNSQGTGPMVNNHPPRRDFDNPNHPNPTQQWLGGTPQYL